MTNLRFFDAEGRRRASVQGKIPNPQSSTPNTLQVVKLLAIEGHLKDVTADDVIKFGRESMMLMARLCVKHLR